MGSSKTSLNSSSRSPVMEREYEFFVTTEEPQQPDGLDRGRIRRLVMRNFFETKGSETANCSSKQSSASTVQAKTQLKARFRLSKGGDDKSGRKSKGSGKKGESNKEEVDRKDSKRRSSRRLSAQIATLQPNTDGHIGNEPAAIDKGVPEEYPRPGRRIVLKIIPSAHRFDPFDVLPVPGSAELGLLFNLCKTSREVACDLTDSLRQKHALRQLHCCECEQDMVAISI